MPNRHERRKHAATVEQVKMTPEAARELLARGCTCAFDGCEANYKGTMPSGWRCLWVFHASGFVEKTADIDAKTWDRDATICPDHVQHLESLLKPTGRALLKSGHAGTA